MPMLEDLAAYFNEAEFAESVVIGGVTCSAIVDLDTELQVGEVLDRVMTVQLPTAIAPSAAEGTVCVVRGLNYRVRRVLLDEPDGSTKHLVLSKG